MSLFGSLWVWMQGLRLNNSLAQLCTPVLYELFNWLSSCLESKFLIGFWLQLLQYAVYCKNSSMSLLFRPVSLVNGWLLFVSTLTWHFHLNNLCTAFSPRFLVHQLWCSMVQCINHWSSRGKNLQLFDRNLTKSCIPVGSWFAVIFWLSMMFRASTRLAKSSMCLRRMIDDLH